MIQSAGQRKARGAFFTPLEVSRFIADWAIRAPRDRVLEPSCGDAAFLLPAIDRLDALGAPAHALPEQVEGIDIHAPSLEEAGARLASAGFGATLTVGNFFDRPSEPSYDAVIGNPPFVRYQDFSGEARAKGARTALAQGVRLTGLASSWAAFTIHAAAFLKDDGRLGLVLPAELLSVNYAAPVRRFLMRRFSRVRLILFEQLLFPGVLTEVVLLLAEGRGSTDSFEVHQVQDAAALAGLDAALPRRGFVPVADEKWTSALLPSGALEIYRGATIGGGFARLADWGETYLGAVTGNNGFFTLSAADARQHELGEADLLRISPPGGRHLRGLTFADAAWREQAEKGASCFLFAPRGPELSSAARAYIALGEQTGVPDAYKCKVWAPWWRVPLVAQPDLFFAYMSHERPRFVANEAKCQVLNSLYGVKLMPGLRTLGQATVPVASLNTLTLLGSEIVGRAYGGGLLKHEPKEADLLPLPSAELMREAEGGLRALAPQLAVALRGDDLGRAVDLVDAVVLKRHLGLSVASIEEIRRAREAMFERRRTRGRGSDGQDR